MENNKVTKANHADVKNESERLPILNKYYEQLRTDVNAHITGDGALKADTIAEYTSATGITVDGVLIKDSGISLLTGGISITPNVTQYTTLTTLTAAEIVGTAAGDIGHTSGATLVAAPGAGYALQFVNAVLIYDYATAAYTGGAGDDMVVQIGTVTASGAVATADLITKAGDTVINLSSLTTDYVMGVNSTINLNATEITQPGTAAGVIRAYVTYNVITTGL